jgi:hypothetical protein
MTREEVLKHRNEALKLSVQLDQLGDYDANAAAIRSLAHLLLAAWQHLLDRMPRRS